MLGNIYRRVAALPLLAKVLLGVAALLVLGLLIVLSPLVAFLAFLVLIVAVIALVFRILRRRPLRTWGLIALVSFVALVLFGGISGAILGGAPQQASSPSSEEKIGATPAPSEPEKDDTTSPEVEIAGDSGATSSETDEETAQGENGQGGYDATVRVTRVVDGDTVRISPAVDGNDEVRLIGVDTPETKEPDCDVQPYGPESSEFTTSELQGEEVELEFDEEREDRYGRLLAYVHKDGDLFNETLLQEGYAQVYTVPPNDRYENRFEEAQAEARAAGRGIWALSASEQALLKDRGNGIGGAGCTREETTAAPEPLPPEPTPDPDPDPDPVPEPDVPPVTPTPSTPSTPPPPAPPGPSNGVDCSTGVRNVPVVPGSKGDRDKDGIACEER